MIVKKQPSAKAPLPQAGHIQVSVLTDTHIHQGRRLAIGSVIAVTRTEAGFLLRAGVINKIPASLNKQEQDHG